MTKRGRGRPKKERTRDKGIRVKCYPEELALFHEEAKKRNITTSEFIRRCVYLVTYMDKEEPQF